MKTASMVYKYPCMHAYAYDTHQSHVDDATHVHPTHHTTTSYRIAAALRQYKDHAEWEIQRWAYNYSVLPPAHKAILSHLPLKLLAAQQAAQTNAHFFKVHTHAHIQSVFTVYTMTTTHQHTPYHTITQHHTPTIHRPC